ncbi:transient receptor potential ion channel family protein [Aspergillus vadensis CBS 113365]|uniref:TRP-domain-containing protein n=1 Tax=Aspergillus vadensis (strain CBS 113365 / IMI 142717 / IBT 24658) TaxID=1448311 RepID=A0A319BAA5_ASPVC|nr:TRP-domain-containing protein [Aspergillus vadensis CBS 113365]PYH68764.1 TRP-domain-containing protein [Aspergillus vadensis CBS 113365]
MRIIPSFSTLTALGLLATRALAADTLSTNGLTTCMSDSAIQVDKLSVTYTRSTREIVFDVSGTNGVEQNVTAILTIYAYGNQLYSETFDPCSSKYYVEQLCPVAAGSFSATGTQTLPESIASEIPSIAFAIPDLDGQVKLQLLSKTDNDELACIQSELTNGNSMQIAGVSYAAAGVAGAALAVSGLSALGAVGHPGAVSSSPSFGDVVSWFHTMATNGMLSVSYPTVYRSFSKNFAFSTGLIPWGQMQESIDNFRKSTGGNLTDNSYQYLINATLVYSDGTNSSSKSKRGLDLVTGLANLAAREVSTSYSSNTTSSSNSTSDDSSSFEHFVSGIEAYAEQLTIPQANTFMTVLLIFAILIAAIAVGILLLKVILEVWALYGSFPDKLTNFRKDYWGLLGRTITNLILLLYGVWVIWCVYQLSSGDSWAAKLLAAVALTVFTAVLLYFGLKIMFVARKYKKAEGDASHLYDNDETWRKYSLFYDNYKKDYWWAFVPAIVYMFAKGCVIAAGDGHGLAQSAGQLIVEALMLTLLLWNRPYVAKSSQWINISVQVVRVLSIACVLIFVDELGLSETTKTVTGIVLIAIQSGLSGILAILIATNAIILCIRENPHAKRKREANKMNRDLDDLTPLDARESLLMEHPPRKDFAEMSKFNFTGPYEPYRDQHDSKSRHSPTGSTDRLVDSSYPLEDINGRSISRESRRSHDSHGSHENPEKHHATTPGYGFAY